MNTLKKLSVAAVLGAVTLGSTAFVCAEGPRNGLDVSAAVSAVDQQVALDMNTQMLAALAAPRAARVHQSPSVSIAEIADVVVVAATRLPAVDPIEVARVARTARL